MTPDQRAKRLHYHLYESCEGIREQSERIVKLEELVADLYLCSDETCTDCKYHNYSGEGFWCKRGVGWKRQRMRELGIEVNE